MIPDEPTWRRIVQAHTSLAQAQSAGDTKAATKSWRELSGLIEGVGKGEGEPTLDDRRQEVLDALFEAAKDRNVTAILKWLDLHRGEFDEPEAPAVASENADGSETVIEAQPHSTMIGELEDAFSGTAKG
jgi:hypothetical protein